MYGLSLTTKLTVVYCTEYLYDQYYYCIQ
eukprot:SAG31_NODE_47818_length_215_cov_35.672414_1_plen_28_part_01